MKTFRERFEEKIEPIPFSGCWLWVGATNGNGYGAISVKRKNKPAHRIIYEIYKGPIQEGLEIDHLCRVPCCVNPDHLEAVTHKENVRRAGSWQENKTHCVHGHEFTKKNTCSWIKPNGRKERKCRACGNRRDREYYHAKRKEAEG